MIILCTTRTRQRFIDGDYRKGLGIIHEAKRFNVAITRAKELLIIIGHAELLQQDSNWRALLCFCYRNGLFDNQRSSETWKPDEDEITTPILVSRLERALVYKTKVSSNKNLKGPVFDDPMWISGMPSDPAYFE